ncbi:putative flavodoxin [Methanocella paludicola SANAE]|uniref:Flavodoxin n=1 Tax=Methanocella paludicola (strain DSM 17711 / JCM 13418 / NBRC 101707 / SANAE) TaxID=304371 RepID=D1YYG2_METPS|nr:flavodoxin domain-containing protein [Methanocella paludicola]BAI61484.1 putative flavodoxin [Methanocella paludicola SANAE]
MLDLLLVYVTKSGNTRLVAEAIADGARSMGLEARAADLRDIETADILGADVVAIGSPTYEQRMLPLIEKLIDSLDSKKCRGKPGIAFGSYGWSGEAPIFIAKRMRELGFDVLDPVMRVQYKPNDKDIEACERLGKDIALKLKSLTRRT